MYNELLHTIKIKSSQVAASLREQAIEHYRSVSGGTREDAENLYSRMVIVAKTAPIVVGADKYRMAVFVGTGKLIQTQSTESDQIKKAIGILGEDAVFARVDIFPEANAVSLAGIKDAFVICGDPDRLRNPARQDYEPDPMNIICSLDHLPECKAASAMLAMGTLDSVGGLEASFSKLASENREYGRCEVVILEKLSQSNIDCLFVGSFKDEESIRTLLMQMNRLVPIEVIEKKTIRQKDYAKNVADNSEVIRSTATPMYFSVGDRVGMKRTVSNSANVFGSIVSMDINTLTVEWDHGERTVYDIMEALARLQAEPIVAKNNDGDVIYALPGMDSTTMHTVARMGIDPVNVYALSSHSKPSSQGSTGWRDHLKSSMSSLGIYGNFVKGYVEVEDQSEQAFVPGEWFEGKLPSGYRLVIDLSKNIKILALKGDEDGGYVSPSQSLPTLE